MRKIIVASVLALGLAACGGSGGGAKATLVKACTDEGDNTAEECDCMATQMVEKLDKDMLDMIVEASKAEDQDAYMMQKMTELKPEQMQQFMTVAMTLPGECGIEM